MSLRSRLDGISWPGTSFYYFLELYKITGSVSISSSIDFAAIMVKVLAALAPFFIFTLASSHFKRDMRLHEHRDGVPEGFTSMGPAPENAVLRLRIALVQNDIEGLQTKLMDVSTPSNLQYGQWLSKEEVRSY
jgi:hypothetical protein